MANEISIRMAYVIDNGEKQQKSFSFSADQAAVGGPTPGYVTIGVTEEEITFGELSTKGVVSITNLDSTNYIDYGDTTGTYGFRVLPGETWMHRLSNSTSLFVIANTAPCKAIISGFEA